jgi:hypothetical protein
VGGGFRRAAGGIGGLLKTAMLRDGRRSTNSIHRFLKNNSACSTGALVRWHLGCNRGRRMKDDASSSRTGQPTLLGALLCFFVCSMKHRLADAR